MRIAFVIHNQEGTGPYFKVLEQCAAIVAQGHQVTLICTSRRRRLQSQHSVKNGVVVYEAPDLLWGELRQGVDLWNALRRVVHASSQRFDLVHAIDCRPNVILTALHIKYWQRIPLVISWWDLFGGKGIARERSGALYAATVGRVETFFEEYFRKYADAATTITSYLAERLASMNYPREQIMVQHVGTDTSIEYPSKDEARSALGLESDIPTFCFMGTIYKSDLAVLLDALDVLKNQTQYRIFWIGNHHIDDAVCNKYNILPTGYVSTDDMKRYLSAADVCLLPMRVNLSNRARWHSKVSDYFNASRPVVSTPVSDFPSIFANNDVGWMSESDDPASFAASLLQAIHERDEWERKGHNARRYVSSSLDVGVLAGELLDFYGRLLPQAKQEALAS